MDNMENSYVPEIKRTYKDSLFRFMFSDKESILELYNALEGTDYGMDTEVEITTLEDVMYAGIKNDLSFKIAGRQVVLTEHQSTINWNMPLRHLEYVTDTLKRMLQNKELFKYKRIMIPTPEFYVIYTGRENWGTDEVRLSDSYIGERRENSMELVVKVINVRYNNEKTSEVLKRSEKLRGYSLLLAYIDEYKREGKTLKTAVDFAIRRCIAEDILKDFLTTYGMEVRGMLFENITAEEFAEIRAEEKAEEEREKALEQGRTIGLEQGREELSTLILKLIEAGRMDDVKKVAEDMEYQKKLLKEYGL